MTVTNASVYVTDIDTKPGVLTFSVVTPPTHGKFHNILSAVSLKKGIFQLMNLDFSCRSFMF